MYLILFIINVPSSYHLLDGGGEKREFSVHELRSTRSGLLASTDASPSRTTEYDNENEDPSSHQSARDPAVLSTRLGVRSAMSASTLNGSTAAPGFTLSMSRDKVTSSLFMLEPFGAHKVCVYKHEPSASTSRRVIISACTRTRTAKLKTKSGQSEPVWAWPQCFFFSSRQSHGTT